MIAKIKATGKEILVEPYGDEFAQILPDGDYKVYTRKELSFPNDEIDWQQAHIQAAIAAMQGMLIGDTAPHDVALSISAVELADALIAELKRSEDVYAECRRMAAINTAAMCENMTKIQKELQKKGGEQ